MCPSNETTARVTPGPGLMDREDADLIFEAVNVCIRLNPENPLAAAQHLEALVKAARTLVDYDTVKHPLWEHLRILISRVTGKL